MGVEGATAGNIKGELGSTPPYATLTHEAPSAISHQPKYQSNELINLYKYVQWNKLVMKGGIMKNAAYRQQSTLSH